jgi:hypothetical protein
LHKSIGLSSKILKNRIFKNKYTVCNKYKEIKISRQTQFNNGTRAQANEMTKCEKVSVQLPHFNCYSVRRTQ